jgi:acyl-CoA reductase-like NAD-dependent aldehyde dehydrogenase
VPEDVFQNLFLDHRHTRADRAGSFDFINFTGSVGGGQAIERAAAGTFTGSGSSSAARIPAM